MSELFPISQSLIKAMREYQVGNKCGLLIEAEWINKVRMDSSKAMRLGQWFEYKATGQLNYYNEIPVPDRTPSKAPSSFQTKAKNAKKALVKEYAEWIKENVLGSNLAPNPKTGFFEADGKRITDEVLLVLDNGDAVLEMEESFRQKLEAINKELWDASPVSEEFRRAEDQAENFKAYLQEYKWEVIESGIKGQNEELGMTMTLDIHMRIPKGGYDPFKHWKKGEPYPQAEEKMDLNVDLKFTGLIGSSFHKMGWSLDSLPNSDHIVQPVQYALVSGRDRFLFMVFGSTPKMDCLLFPIEVNEGAKLDHLETVETVRNQIQSAIRAGWSPHPSFNHCKECPIAEGCAYRVTVPQAEIVIKLI